MPDLDDIFKALFPKKVRKKLKKKRKKLFYTLLSELKKMWKSLWQSDTRKSRSYTKEDTWTKESRQEIEQKQDVGKTAVLPTNAHTNPTLQAYLQQADDYAKAIETLAHEAEHTLDTDRLQSLSAYVVDWRTKLTHLTQQVVTFQQNDLLQRDLKTVPEAIRKLEKQLAKEENPLVQQEIARTLQQRQRQWTSLDKMQSTVRLAEIKIESTVSMLGTIYSQTQLSTTRGEVANYRHLLDEVQEETLALEDYLTALDEVKFGVS